PEILLDSIRTVTTGGAVIAPTTTRRLLETTLLGSRRRPPIAAQQAKLESLTAREAEILQEMATGDSNAEIARRLFLSEATV
ncbi:LuxR C-terminal-related transcriptional regulator, partial [Salmonella enterica]|uniref:LuxR C-terminal-related transcriptional regulator n=1 Tax=Salmonella enterica TaxID=28901 RepID=UPI003CF727F3